MPNPEPIVVSCTEPNSGIWEDKGVYRVHLQRGRINVVAYCPKELVADDVAYSSWQQFAIQRAEENKSQKL